MSGSFKKILFAGTAASSTMLAMPASAGVAYGSFTQGKLTNVTTVAEGLMIQMDAGPPTNCVNASNGWFLIPQQNQAMTAALLSYWLAGRLDAVVYTSGYSVSGGFCLVNQYDPDD